MDLFFQPKICWKAVGRNLSFAIVESGVFLTAPASFISADESNNYILAFLCSKVGQYFVYQNSDTTGAGDIMLNIQSLVKFPIPKNNDYFKEISLLSYSLCGNYEESKQRAINKLIYQCYGITKEEESFIESQL